MFLKCLTVVIATAVSLIITLSYSKLTAQVVQDEHRELSTHSHANINSKTAYNRFDTLHTVMTACDTVRRSLYNADIDGFFAGTTRKMLRDTLDNKPYYISEHANLFFTPVIKDTDTFKTRIRGVYIWFAEGTKINNAPDNFALKIYNGELKDNPQEPIFVKKFSASSFSDWAPGTVPGNIWNNPNRNLIKIDTTVNLSGFFGVGVETAPPNSDDYLAFHYTRNNDPNSQCPNYNNRWRIFLRDSSFAPYLWVAPTRVNRNGYRMPYFIPILEDYDSASAVISRADIQAITSFQITHTYYDAVKNQLNYKLAFSTTTIPESISLQIMDMNGKLICNNRGEKEGIIKYNLSAGSYLLVAQTKQFLDVRRFVVF